MASMERGGQDALRAPAAPVAAAAVGAIEEKATDDEEEGRLGELPDHERDTDTSEGGGMTGSGVMAEQRGASEERAEEPADEWWPWRTTDRRRPSPTVS